MAVAAACSAAPPGRFDCCSRASATRRAGCSASPSWLAWRSSSSHGCAASDPRTGWLIAIGGAFLTTAVAFSFASGIFHPYYVSLLAPFAAALIGAGVGMMLDGPSARVIAPLAIGGGI